MDLVERLVLSGSESRQLSGRSAVVTEPVDLFFDQRENPLFDNSLKDSRSYRRLLEERLTADLRGPSAGVACELEHGQKELLLLGSALDGLKSLVGPVGRERESHESLLLDPITLH